MPQIIVTADGSNERGDAAVMLRERVNLSDFHSSHFAKQLLERLGWAVEDAQELERDGDPAEPSRAEVERSLAELSGQQPAQELERATLR